MAKPRPDEESFEENPRARKQPRPARQSDEDDDRPVRRSQPARRRDDDDDEDDRPRRRSRRSRSRGDEPFAGIIPYKNGLALAAYYCSVFGLIPGVGIILGPLSLIFGIIGLRRVNENPEIRGTGHAITGIVLGSLETLFYIALAVLVVGGAFAHRR